jgi:predicted metal-binding protein
MEFYKIQKYYSITDLNAEKIKETLTIDEIVEKLSIDNNYNERLYDGHQYKFYLDIEVENLKIETVQNSLLNFFNTHLKLKLLVKDIKYTFNDFKIKKGLKEESYHITIPKFYSEKEVLREVANEITKLYGFKCDPSVYSNKRWFRLPNQSGEAKDFKTGELERKHPHIIQNGKIKDFVLQYVDKTNSVNIKKHFEKYKPKEEPIKKEKKTKKTKEAKEPNTQDDEKIPDDLNNLDLLLNGLKTSWLNDWINWNSLGYLLFCIGSTVEKWIEISKKDVKFQEGECEKVWSKFTVKKRYTIGTLHYWVKKSNGEYYSKLKFKQPEKKELVETIKIHKQYLTKELEDKTLEIDDDLIPYFDDMFINKKYKSINIKSPYGSSKTQLIKRVIEKYNPEKVLWLSFRQTLSDDIENNFKDLDFKHYQTSKLNVNRLIIQEESLLKLQSYEDVIEAEDGVIENITHTYDLIMLDEVESLLNQYHSQATFGSKTKETFEYLEQLLYKSKNIISLDGDLGDRSKCFLMKFDNYLFLENQHKNNNKTITVYNSREKVDEEMFDLLKMKKKIAIASMTSKDATDYKNLISEKFPKLKIGIYISTTDCKSKKDLKNVIEKWGELDVVIYSPTITAGVSFDLKKYFYKIFGVISCGSCSQRDFFQMLARIRYPESNDITVFNNGITGDSSYYFTFEEVKNAMIETRKLKIIYKDGKSRQDIDFDIYTINYIYNKVEELNKSDSLFLNYLDHLGTEKGYKMIFENKEDSKNYICERIEELKEFDSKNDKIINSRSIDMKEYKELLEKQNKQETVEKEHFEITKKTLELQMSLKIDKNLNQLCGLNEKTGEPIIKNLMEFYVSNPSSIKNFSYLVDEDNLKEVDDAFTENKKKQLYLINKFFEKIGFENVMTKKMIKAEKVEEALKGLEIFTKENQIIFNKQRQPKDINDKTRTQIEYINSILENYKLSIVPVYDGGRVKENKFYKLNRLHYIDEILLYKKFKKQIKDSKNIITLKGRKLTFEKNSGVDEYYKEKCDYFYKDYLKRHFNTRNTSYLLDGCEDGKQYKYYFYNY